MKKSTILIIVILLAAGAGGYFVLNKGNQTPSTPGSTEEPGEVVSKVSDNFVKGKPAPEVTLIDFEGKKYYLSDFKGKAVILDFWAAWCPFCIAEMPELQQAQDKYQDSLVMIGIHRTDTEKKEKGLEFVQERGVSYLLTTDTDGSLYRAAGGFGMPVAVFIDKDGVVIEIKSGPKTEKEIEEKIGSLVK